MHKKGKIVNIKNREIPYGHFKNVAFLVYKSTKRPEFHREQLKEIQIRMEIEHLEQIKFKSLCESIGGGRATEEVNVEIAN